MIFFDTIVVGLKMLLSNQVILHLVAPYSKEADGRVFYSSPVPADQPRFKNQPALHQSFTLFQGCNFINIL